MSGNADLVAKVCLLPLTYREGDKTPKAIAIDSGYVDDPESLTRVSMINFLNSNSHLLREWEGLSNDQRYSPAWVFNTDTGLGRVWLHPTGPDMTFENLTEACAEFIFRFMDQHFARPPRHQN